MALGGIILYIMQNLQSGGVAAKNIIASGSDYSAEIRVRFPGPTDTVLPPSELSGSIWTLSNGSVGANYASLWYEKSSATSMTGNIYLTSSAGRLQLSSLPIFDDGFCNLAVVKEHVTGTVTLYAIQHQEGEQTLFTSSVASFGSAGAAPDANYTNFEVGSSVAKFSNTQFWGQEVRLWTASLDVTEVLAHSLHFESYGRDVSWNNRDLLIHWRMNDGTNADGSGKIYPIDSTLNMFSGTGSLFTPSVTPFVRFLADYAYIPSIDYGWNQKKIRIYNGSTVEPRVQYRNHGYRDERFVSLEFNMVDALNEDLSEIMSSYDELIDFVGYPVNRYRETYEGLQQMRETYFKRLQGELSFRIFADMLDFFDRSFVDIVRRLLPARALFKGDEFIVESHMLERPKYQYELRPIQDGFIDVSGSIPITDLWGEMGH